MKENANVNSYDMWTLLISSVRYAMWRQTSVVSDVCSCVRRHYKALEDWQVAQIAREIREELERASKTEKGTLGADCDHKDWIALAEFLEAR